MDTYGHPADEPCAECATDHGCLVHGPTPRERPVPCQVCRGRTMNYHAVCDTCRTREPL